MKSKRLLEDGTYARFERLLDDEKLYLDPCVTFSSLCRLSGAPRRDMDRLLVEELGVGGSDLLRIYRRAEPLRRARLRGELRLYFI